ncbi:hypothetical protein [Paractinoplanes rishiriensis]|uniref:SH3 domain-containing protein n=1 Tax=Paractinoplanes rishiriensis TaxID=1050105 RepID=A0A919MYM1_9ACTN|nr:hypothetical protein [Actinoplanes rishiriensis]GIE97205.1 hypothetical protein Ari01nite_46700 [Actinoplanes rishiriensis]
MRARTGAALAAITLATGGLVATTASPAAASCSHAHSFLDGYIGFISGTDAALRVGPHHTGTACRIVDRAYYGDAAQYHCYTSGSTYNGWSTWTWVYVPSLNKSGWVNDALLYGRGAVEEC